MKLERGEDVVICALGHSKEYRWHPMKMHQTHGQCQEVPLGEWCIMVPIGRRNVMKLCGMRARVGKAEGRRTHRVRQSAFVLFEGWGRLDDTCRLVRANRQSKSLSCSFLKFSFSSSSFSKCVLKGSLSKALLKEIGTVFQSEYEWELHLYEKYPLLREENKIKMVYSFYQTQPCHKEDGRLSIDSTWHLGENATTK